jgi:DNA-binding MarR family transcriptional regulator
MTRDNSRRELELALMAEVRGTQRDNDELDELVSRQLGVNRTDARCLDVLDERGRMTAGELAAATGLTTGAITGVLDRLERAGYVERVRDTADRRRVLVDVTQLMRDRTAEFYGPLGAASGPLLERYGDDELELLVRFLREARGITREHIDRLRAGGEVDPHPRA